MKLFVFVISLAFNGAFAQSYHVLHYMAGCFFNDTVVELIYEYDRNLALYVDFKNNDVVVTLPPYVPFDISQYPQILVDAKKAERACRVAHVMIEQLLQDTEPDVQEPPESILYPADEVQNAVENNLICFVNNFYPPHVNITWTKNNHPVSEGVTISPYMLNDDQTFQCFATLTFIPVHGDVYSCTVEHSALDAPKTKIWDVDLSHHQDLALDLYCGLGLTVGFVGVAVGTFLIVKGLYGR